MLKPILGSAPKWVIEHFSDSQFQIPSFGCPSQKQLSRQEGLTYGVLGWNPDSVNASCVTLRGDPATVTPSVGAMI